MKPQLILQQEKSAVDVSEVSDTEILAEYVNRFTIKAGESIKSARAAADHFRAFFADAAKKEKFVICFLKINTECFQLKSSSRVDLTLVQYIPDKSSSECWTWEQVQ